MRLEIYRPIKPYYTNENNKFGMNPEMYKQYGLLGHNGIDVAAYDWQPCYAPIDGVVVEVSTERERGLGVGIQTNTTCDFGNEYFGVVRLWHFAATNVKVGDKVGIGDLVGWCDNTGYSTGTHLHLELKVRDINGQNVWPGNGFGGAIDPEPYLRPEFAIDLKSWYFRLKAQLAQLMSIWETYLTKTGGGKTP